MTVRYYLQRKRKLTSNKIKVQRFSGHGEFLKRITKTFYYGKVPLSDQFSLPVTELAAELFSEVKEGVSLDRLHVDEASEISRNTCVSPCSLVLALFYLERLKTCNLEYVEKVAASELFLVAMMVASKFLHDDGEEDEVYNYLWASSGGLEVEEMNRLEREFLDAINWEVYVSEKVFWERLQALEKTLALRQGRRRGWFTYTELAQLIKTAELFSIAHTLIKVSGVCLVSYTAGVLVIVGSTVTVTHIPPVVTSICPWQLFAGPVIPLHNQVSSNQTLPDLQTDLIYSVPTSTSFTLFENYPRHRKIESGIKSEPLWNSLTGSGYLKVNNLTFLENNKKKEWPEPKDWLTAISNLVLASRPRILPLKIFMY